MWKGNMTVAIRKIAAIAFFAGGLMFMGCDKTEFDGDATVEGIVTNEAQYAKTEANIEGATVTAARLTATGTTQPMSGQATSDAEGRFSLQTDATSDAVILTATRDEFRTQLLVDGGLQAGTVTRVGPMTGESHAEAEVYVAARSTAEGDAVTSADVSAHVNAALAAQVRGAADAAGNVAAAISKSANAETRYLTSSGGGGASASQVQTARRNKRSAYANLQASLHAAATASARAQAIRAFKEDVVDAYSQANISLMAQARARQAAVRALLLQDVTAAARTQLRKQASILAAIASGLAVENEFRTRGAASAEVDAIAAARTQWVSSLRAATSAESINQANAAFYAAVRTQLASHLDVSETSINLAADAMAQARTALDLSLAAAATAQAIADAYVTFFSAAPTASSAVLAESTSAADAEFGANVIVLLSIQAQPAS